MDELLHRGNLDGKDIDLVSVLRYRRKWNHGDMTAEDIEEVSNVTCPGPSGCGGM